MIVPDKKETHRSSECDWLLSSTCAPHRRLVSMGTDSPQEGSDEDVVNVMKALHEHHDSMEAVCRSILSNASDAKDALQQAKENAIKRSPGKPERGWRVWLNEVTRNAAIDIYRTNVRSEKRRAPLDDAENIEYRDMTSVNVRAAKAQRLLERSTQLLDEAEQVDYRLFRDIALRTTTAAELAEQRGMPFQELKQRRKRGYGAIKDAAIAISLIDAYRLNRNRCVVPHSYAAGMKGPELLEAIREHKRRCRWCGSRWAKPTWVLKQLLGIPVGLGAIAGALAAVLKATLASKKAVAATALSVTTATAAVTVAVFTTSPNASRFERGRSSSEPSIAPSSSSTTGSPPSTPESTPSNPPESPTRPPTSLTPPPPLSTSPAPPTPTSFLPDSILPSSPTDGGARDDSPPAITAGWIEHRRIVASRRSTCDGEPTTSEVHVSVSSSNEVTTVRAHLRAPGYDIPFLMTRHAGMSTWHGQLGPLADDTTSGRFEVIIEVVGANGATVEKQIGEICVARCSREPLTP